VLVQGSFKLNLPILFEAIIDSRSAKERRHGGRATSRDLPFKIRNLCECNHAQAAQIWHRSGHDGQKEWNLDRVDHATTKRRRDVKSKEVLAGDRRNKKWDTAMDSERRDFSGSTAGT
jgi:hypothetical protein